MSIQRRRMFLGALALALIGAALVVKSRFDDEVRAATVERLRLSGQP